MVAQVALQHLIVRPVERGNHRSQVLRRLAESLPYAGRARAGCAARVDPAWAPGAHDRWVPLDAADAVRGTATAVLAPVLPLRFEALAGGAGPAGGRSVLPVGTRLVGYELVRRGEPLRPLSDTGGRPAGGRTPGAPASSSLSGCSEAVRFALSGQSPPATDAVVVTDLLRQAALSRLGRTPGDRPFTRLGGRSGDATGGSPSAAQHRHSHFLPLITGGRVTGLVVWTPDGLPEDERAALLSVRVLAGSALRLDVRVTATGAVEQIMPELTGPAVAWESVTPFTTQRHAKHDRSAFLRAELARELAFRGLPEPAMVDIVSRAAKAWFLHRPGAAAGRCPEARRTSTPPTPAVADPANEPTQH